MQDALNRERARISEIESKTEILRAETERRIVDTMTRRDALIAEEEGNVKALIARAEGELRVQLQRVEQARRQLEADVIAPANADMEAKTAEARGRASRVIEDGKATAQVLEQMIDTWQRGGPSARDIFLMQKLKTTMSQMVSTIQNVHVDRLTVLPPDAQVSARKAVTLVEELKGALGVDLPRIVEAAINRPQQ